MPRVRPRLFINRLQGGDPFREVELHLETLFLFPDRERGIVLYRGLTTCLDEEMEDIAHCLAELEILSDPPRNRDQYRERFRIWLATGEAPPEPEETPPPEADPSPEPDAPARDVSNRPEPPPEPPADREDAPEGPPIGDGLTKMKALQERIFQKLRQLGVDPEDMLKNAAAAEREKEALMAVEAAMPAETRLARVLTQSENLMQKFGFTKEDLLKTADNMKRVQQPSLTPADALAICRARGLNNPELENALLEMDRVYRKHRAEEAEQVEKPPKPTRERAGGQAIVPESPRNAAEALAWHQAGKSLAGLDLSGFDFTGMDLTAPISNRPFWKKRFSGNAFWSRPISPER